jgi:hypothetical protein
LSMLHAGEGLHWRMVELATQRRTRGHKQNKGEWRHNSITRFLCPRSWQALRSGHWKN